MPRLTLIPAVVAFLLACGGATKAEAPLRPDPQVAQKMAQMERRIARLEAALQQTAARLDRAEQRLGLRPFDPSSLRQASNGALNLGKAKLLAKRGARARTRSLKQHVAEGRGAVFALWATWCKPCIADGELAHLRDLRESLPSDVPLINIACDGIDKVKAHAKADRWLYPLWQKNDGHIDLLPKSFIDQNGLGLPLFVVVDAQGEMRWWRNAPLSNGVIDELITAATVL
jgi:thiol-disulfide isomerase/thioredoxin